MLICVICFCVIRCHWKRLLISSDACYLLVAKIQRRKTCLAMHAHYEAREKHGWLEGTL